MKTRQGWRVAVDYWVIHTGLDTLSVPGPNVTQSLPPWQVEISSCIPGTRPVSRSAYSPAASSQPRGCWCQTWSTKLQANFWAAQTNPGTVSCVGRQGSTLLEPLALPEPSCWAPRGLSQACAAKTELPERPPQPPRNSPGSSQRRPPQSVRPARTRLSSGRGGHNAGRSLPLPRGPTTPVVTSQPG